MSENIFRQFRIQKIINETSLCKTFVLEPEDKNFTYNAGQFLTLVFQTPFGEKRRSYSISSSPTTDDFLSITIKRQENGEFSRYMLDHSKEGDVLISTGVSGFFTLKDDEQTDEHVFFAAGSGITPCFSMIKTILDHSNKNVLLIYSNKSVRDTIFYDQLILLKEKYSSRFSIQFLFTNSNVTQSRRLSKDLIPQLINPTINSKKIFYLCGPFEYMRMIRITLISLGIDEEWIRKENFNDFPVSEMKAPPDLAMHDVTVQIAGEKHILKVKYPYSIIATAKSNNISLPYSCEAGRCGSCVAKCTKGKIWMSYNEVLTEKDISHGLVLTCQGFPIDGDAEIFFI